MYLHDCSVWSLSQIDYYIYTVVRQYAIKMMVISNIISKTLDLMLTKAIH